MKFKPVLSGISHTFLVIFFLIPFIMTVSCSIKEKDPQTDFDVSSDVEQVDTLNIDITESAVDSLFNTGNYYTNANFSDSVRGLYISAYTVETPDFEKLLSEAVTTGLNTVVFDLKNMKGEVFFRTAQKRPLPDENIQPIIDLPYIIKLLHGLNLKAVSRVVMFHDQYWAVNDTGVRPETANGEPWIESERRGPSWLDPSNPEVQKYLFSLLEEIASSGIDEIQLDYIRFPTQGDLSNSIYYFQKEDSVFFAQDTTYVFRQREDVITDFVAKAETICSKYGATLTADVFAIVSWQRESDISSTGQNIKRLSEHLDAIHPMIYSSHFSDNFGFRNDVHNEPYYLVYKAAKLTRLYTAPSCKVIPYIQANSYMVNYGKEYVYAEIRAVQDLGLSGYLLWNSQNNYWSTLSWLQNYPG